MTRRLPMPRPGQVLGLVGQNGTGKSTALKILAGKLKPNLGRCVHLASAFDRLVVIWYGMVWDAMGCVGLPGISPIADMPAM